MGKSGRFSRLEVGNKDRIEGIDEGFGNEERDARWYLDKASEAERGGRFEHALRHYTRSLQDDKGLTVAWVGQVRMLVELGEYEEARLWSDKALEVFRQSSELMSAKAQACARLGDIKAALAANDLSLKADGSTPWRWQVRGEVLLASGGSHAEKCFKKSLAEDGVDWYDRVKVARILLYYDKASAAMGYARNAVELDATQGLSWFVQGECQRELGLKSPAIHSYKKCLEVNRNFPEVSKRLAELETESFLGGLVKKFGGWFK